MLKYLNFSTYFKIANLKNTKYSNFYFNPPARGASREVADLTERKYKHTHYIIVDNCLNLLMIV